MKKVLNRISAAVLSLALLVSLTPITGFAVIANEAEEGTPAATTEETEKAKDPGDSGASKHKETKKDKESPKSEKETPKETKQTEAEAPKETDKKETEAPKESDKSETTTPKETKKTETEVPEATKAAEPETSKEPVATETEAPKETEASEPETSKEPETSETEAPKETEATEPETSKEPEESATKPSEPEETEATEPETSETEETTEPTESTEPEEAEGEADNNVSSDAKKTPVVIGTIDVTLNSSSGVMSWTDYSGAANYILFISCYNSATVDPAASPVNLKTTIDNLIKVRELEKNPSGNYTVALEAYDSNGIMIANWEDDFNYKSSSNAQTGSIQNIAFNDSTGVISWNAYPGATDYTISIDGYEADWVTTTSYSGLKETIDRLVKSDEIYKPSDNKYTITIHSINKEGEITANGNYTLTYTTQSDPVSWSPITGVNLTSGILTWDALTGAAKYYIEIDCSCGYYTTSTKFALGTQIDKLVALQQISKSDSYWVGLSAYDSDNDYIGGWEGHFSYTPTTNPGSSKIQNVKISKGILTWKAVTGASCYCIEIGDDYASVYVNSAKTNLFAQVDYLIKTGDLTKVSTGRYPFTIYAEDFYGNSLASYTGSFTYKSKAAPVTTGNLDITFHTEGHITWNAYKGTSYYIVELDGGETYRVAKTTFDFSKQIDWHVKNGDFEKKTWYDVLITAYDKTNVPLATGYESFSYKTSSTPISRGQIAGVKVTNGVLSWDKYSGASKYAITISNSQGTIPYVTGNSFKLSEYIYKLIATGGIWQGGYYQVCITAIDSQGFFIAEKMLDYYYTQEPNGMKTAGRTASVKYKKLKKKNQSVSRVKVIAVSGAAGKVTYRKIAGSKKILINASTGKVTVKKKLKKGTYRVTVQVRAAGNAYYQPSEVQTVTFVIRVK